MSTTEETFQLSLHAAEVYEATFVPTLFAEWAPHVVDAAAIRPGYNVLDVACGTGVVAREVSERLGGSGSVVGLDLNESMLAVARRVRPDLEWRVGDAADLPFPDRSFDAVVCQAALMFMPDRVAALREMARVVTEEGTVAVQVWGSLGDQPAYSRLVEVAARHAGPEAIDLLSSYWVLGDLEVVHSLFEAVDLHVITTDTHVSTARFASIDDMVRIEVESTPLIDRIDDDVYARIRRDAREALAQFETADGKAELPVVGHVVVAQVDRASGARQSVDTSQS